ncbi:hypothetical protein CAEBREN_02218 [Caenorhabditis brenneri]|uniref:Uncharacterized protein n=1 Tax=Caenorhabditis brenneri TaxID=135651 RepID=G0MLV3_CAEBE|nr:hypothetical protein CAEBREN_02218 [Caenorhabditis brenneri]
MLLPTTIGTFDLDKDIEKKFGAFPEAFLKCGKATTKVEDLGVEGQTSLETLVDCSPNPMRVVVNKETAANSLFKRMEDPVKFGECMGLQTCESHPNLAKVNLGAGKVDGSKATPLLKNKAENDICQNTQTKAEQILFTNEMGCKNVDEVPNYNALAKNLYIAPRWKTNDDNLFHVMRAFTKTGKGRKNATKVIPRTNNFVKLPKHDKLTADNVWKTCNGGCDKGDVIKFNMGGQSWKSVIYLKGKTKGFKMCIDAENHDSDSAPPLCRSRFEMFILPRNGLVIWPKNGRASPIELKPAALVDDDEMYAIEVGYGVKKGPNGEGRGEFYVANMYREVVISDSDEWDKTMASKVSFFFENYDDLVDNAGIVSSMINSGKTFINKAKENEVKEKQVKNQGDGTFNVADGKESLTNQPDDPPKPIVLTTTASPKRLASNALLGIALQSTDNTNDAIYTKGKWWVWGLYIGFVSGSILSTVLIGVVFYFLRRTVYGFWYRGMYKRYGCDVSGTTAGITGIGFGNTTTGAITVGGGTTGATGMTTGKTGGTTTGGTTGGTTAGTTGSTTGGASTIAM